MTEASKPQDERHVLALTIDNEAGALGRVVGLFSGRGYNIHSLTVSEINHQRHLSRMTIVTAAPAQTIKHIIALLERLVPVHTVQDLTLDSPYIERGLMLIKVKAKGKQRQEVMHIADEFDAKEVDTTPESFVFEISDIPEKLNEFVALMESYGIIELSRTGVTAMARGSEGFENAA